MSATESLSPEQLQRAYALQRYLQRYLPELIMNAEADIREPDEQEDVDGRD